MPQDAITVQDVEDIIAQLSEENKRYVIAVANALVFSQQNGQKVTAVCEASGDGPTE